MIREIGIVKSIYRYPVKSMAGEQLTSADLGWHGIEGDRRLAFVRSGIKSGFPWLSASRLPQLVRYTPFRLNTDDGADLPTHVRTPCGREMELWGETLKEELSSAYGSMVEIMQLDRGMFDEASVSVISQSTLTAIEQKTGIRVDVARFRPNILVETKGEKPFEEDEWVGKVIRIGEGTDAPAINVYMRDVRCMMVNLDPATGESDPGVLKAVARLNGNCAGAYGSVMRAGSVSVGDRLFLQSI